MVPASPTPAGRAPGVPADRVAGRGGDSHRIKIAHQRSGVFVSCDLGKSKDPSTLSQRTLFLAHQLRHGRLDGLGPDLVALARSGAAGRA